MEDIKRSGFLTKAEGSDSELITIVFNNGTSKPMRYARKRCLDEIDHWQKSLHRLPTREDWSTSKNPKLFSLDSIDELFGSFESIIAELKKRKQTRPRGKTEVRIIKMSEEQTPQDTVQDAVNVAQDNNDDAQDNIDDTQDIIDEVQDITNDARDTIEAEASSHLPELVNFTSKQIVVHWQDKHSQDFEPSGQVILATCQLALDDPVIGQTWAEYEELKILRPNGQVEPFPEPQEGIYLFVDKPIAKIAQATGRSTKDLLYPYETMSLSATRHRVMRIGRLL